MPVTITLPDDLAAALLPPGQEPTRAGLEVRPDPNFDPSLELLDPGEAAALSLAESLGADAILIDDLAGRTEAERRHLTVTGTLGVLVEAHIAGLLKFDEALEKLRSTN